MILDRFKIDDASSSLMADRKSLEDSALKNSSKNQALQNIVETIHSYYESFEDLLKSQVSFDAFGNLLRFDRDKFGYPKFKHGFVSESLIP